MKGGSGEVDVALSDLDINCDIGHGCGTILQWPLEVL
jgi:hypothetical protein